MIHYHGTPIGGSLARFGMYKPATSSQRAAVIADRIESHNSAHAYEFLQIQEELT